MTLITLIVPFSKEQLMQQVRQVLPLKPLAFGIPAHAFRDCFQMSRPQAVKCVEEFTAIIAELYEDEYEKPWR